MGKAAAPPTPTPTPAPAPTPEPTPAPTPTPEPTPAPAPAAKTYTEAEYQANLAKAQKDWEKKVKEAEDRASLSETERTKAERDDALNALRERDTRDAVIDAASAAGVKNAKLFYNAYKSEFETDDKGKITNLKEVLASAKTESPELFTTSPQPEGGADGGEGKGANTGGLTRELIDKMSPAEVVANMDKIDQFLATQK